MLVYGFTGCRASQGWGQDQGLAVCCLTLNPQPGDLELQTLNLKPETLPAIGFGMLDVVYRFG